VVDKLMRMHSEQSKRKNTIDSGRKFECGQTNEEWLVRTIIASVLKNVDFPPPFIPIRATRSPILGRIFAVKFGFMWW
jgi:hypothetical protein